MSFLINLIIFGSITKNPPLIQPSSKLDFSLKYLTFGPKIFIPPNLAGGLTAVNVTMFLFFIRSLLLPGTLIVVDGRTANSRFLLTNFQREWGYYHDEEWDQHFFELQEKPLGIYNKRQIDFCLGLSYFDRLSEMKKAKAIYTGVQK